MYKAKIKGRDDNYICKMQATENTTSLYVEEVVQLFFKLYKKLGFINSLTVIIHSRAGDTVLQHND